MKIPQKYLNRQDEITASYLAVMNRHMDDFMAGSLEEMFHIKDIASIMCLHPVHVSNIVKLTTGHHPCYFYELRILNEAKQMLSNPALSITDVANRLTYDTSNFTKFFKVHMAMTPKEYRKNMI